MKPHALLNKTLIGIRWIAWLNANRRPATDAVEEIITVKYHLHAEAWQEFAIEHTAKFEAADGQHDVSHSIDLDCHVFPRLLHLPQPTA
jgi:hypothetical protein